MHVAMIEHFEKKTIRHYVFIRCASCFFLAVHDDVDVMAVW